MGIPNYFSTFKSNKAEVRILFNNNFNLQLHDNPAFFLDIFRHCKDFKCNNIIIGDDFNLVLDLEKDKTGSLAKTHQNSIKNIQQFSENLDLVDAWRVLHMETSRYAWRRRWPKVQCRLDFFLVH